MNVDVAIPTRKKESVRSELLKLLGKGLASKLQLSESLISSVEIFTCARLADLKLFT